MDKTKCRELQEKLTDEEVDSIKKYLAGLIHMSGLNEKEFRDLRLSDSQHSDARTGFEYSQTKRSQMIVEVKDMSKLLRENAKITNDFFIPIKK